MKSFLYTILAVTTLLPGLACAEEKAIPGAPETSITETKIVETKTAGTAVTETKVTQTKISGIIPANPPAPAETKFEVKPLPQIEPVPVSAVAPVPAPVPAPETKPAKKTRKADVVTLEQSLAAAYKYNPDLKSAIADLEATNELSAQAFSEWLPTANLDMDYGKRRSKFGTSPRNNSNVNAKTLSISQPLFKGTISAASDRADNLIKSAQYNFQSTEQQLMLVTITVYMDLLTNHQVHQLSKNRVEILERQFDETSARFDVGELTKTDVSQANARLASALAEESRAASRLEASRANFVRLTGLDPKGLSIPTELPEIPASYREALRIAKRESPLLNSSKYYEEAAENQVSIAKGQLLPKLSLNAAASREQDNSFSGADFSNDSLTLNVNVPLYQGGAEYSRVRESKKEASAATFDRVSAMNQVVEETRTAWKEARISSANIKSTERAVEAAEIALEGVRAEEEEGLRTIIDVLDAEQELFSAKTALLTSKRDQIIAYYSLLDKIGRLTAHDLGLRVDLYDKNEALEDVKYKFIGF